MQRLLHLGICAVLVPKCLHFCLGQVADGLAPRCSHSLAPRALILLHGLAHHLPALVCAPILLHGLQVRPAGLFLGIVELVPGLALFTGAPRAPLRQLLTATAQPHDLSAIYVMPQQRSLSISLSHHSSHFTHAAVEDALRWAARHLAQAASQALQSDSAALATHDVMGRLLQAAVWTVAATLALADTVVWLALGRSIAS
jgi:hypothetical protein